METMELHLDNRGLDFRQVQHEIGIASDKLKVGYDTLYAYLFQCSLAFVQTRIIAGCRAVVVIVQYGSYDDQKDRLESGRLVHGYLLMYGQGESHMTSCLYTFIGDTVNAASDYFDRLVATCETEVKA